MKVVYGCNGRRVHGCICALKGYDATRSRYFGLIKAVGAQYSEVSIIHIGHGRDTSLHAQLIFWLLWILSFSALF